MRSLWNRLTALLLEDTSTSGTKFAVLDGLRGIAVLVVFLSHSSGFDQRLVPFINFHGTGHIGVYLFFVLSGFLLAYALLQRNRVNLGAFWLRRFFRIAPLYYLIVTSVFAYQVLLNRGGWIPRNLHVRGGWTGYLQHIFFYKGDSVFWTIAAEFQFYFILPFLIMVLLKWGGRGAWTLALVAVGYFGWTMAITFGGVSSDYALKIADIVHNSQYSDVFICGILAAWLFLSRHFQSWWSVHAAILRWTPALVAAVLAAASLVLVANRFASFNQPWAHLRDLSLLYAAGFGWVLLGALNAEGSVFQRILNWQWLRIIGVTGFSWYLIHFPIINKVNAWFGHAPVQGVPPKWTFAEPARWSLSFMLTAIAAVLLYLCIEKPFMMLSRSFGKKRVTTEGKAPA